MPRVIKVSDLSETDNYDAPYYVISKDSLEKEAFEIPDEAEWIHHEDEWEAWEECSNCKGETLGTPPFCPMCGARMTNGHL